ncbi:hypothetical protein [Photobacterium sp. J15]|uniref:hypothetical protein n=1 Tax=Photobacterium sp. J15 TaxID=265901 RepID=UPI0007E3C710|nr:hypothetical protein [Photobacterium sp. J15]
MSINLKDLPYPNMPSTLKEQVKFLAEILGVPRNLLTDADETELQAMCYVIMYRHLSQLQRNKAMRVIHSVKRRALVGSLVEKAVDTTFVNPQWGIWSLSNTELLEDIASHQQVQFVAGLIGLSASGMSIKDLVKEAVKKKGISTKNLATIAIWGFLIFNEMELGKARKEHENRTSMNSSRFY